MQNTITCPHCNKDFQMDEVFRHQVEDEILQKTQKEFEKNLEKVKVETEEKLRKELIEEQEQLAKNSEIEKKELAEKNKQLRDEQLEQAKTIRELKSKDEERELEMQKKLASEEEKIRLDAQKKAQEEQKFKLLEKDKLLDDARKANEDLKRKLEQGSQQTQGEVLELDFENTLKDAFPTDEIIPIGKGVRGADIKHVVKTERGTICGIILWETKRTKTWDNDWTNKLKNELRTENAQIPIIVSETFPKELATKMGLVNGVWVVDYSHALIIAEIMRHRLIDIAREKYLSTNRNKDNQEQVYDYIVSKEFGQELDALLEVHYALRDQISKEKAAFEKQWKTREEIADKLLKSRSRMTSTLQIKAGNNNQLQIKDSELLGDGSTD